MLLNINKYNIFIYKYNIMDKILYNILGDYIYNDYKNIVIQIKKTTEAIDMDALKINIENKIKNFSIQKMEEIIRNINEKIIPNKIEDIIHSAIIFKINNVLNDVMNYKTYNENIKPYDFIHKCYIESVDAINDNNIKLIQHAIEKVLISYLPINVFIEYYTVKIFEEPIVIQEEKPVIISEEKPITGGEKLITEETSKKKIMIDNPNSKFMPNLKSKPINKYVENLATDN